MEIGKIAGIAMHDAKAGEPLVIATCGSICLGVAYGEEIIQEKPKPVIEKGKIYKLEEEIKNVLD